MSIESRLAAKKRSQQARKREKMGKIMKVVAIIVLLCIIVGAVFGVYWNIQSKKIEYSKYVTADGNIVDVNPKDYITLVDYYKMDITMDDYKPTDDALKEYMEELMEAAEKEAEDSKEETKTSSVGQATTTDDAENKDEEKEDDKKEESIVDSLDDAWVEKYYKKTLEDAKYDVTAEGFKEYAYDELYKSNVDEKLLADITKYLNDKSTVKEYPKDYTKNMIQICKNVEKETFEAYESLYAMYGYANVYAMYGGKTAFNEAMEEQAKAYVKDTLVCLAIYEELGMTYTMDEVKEYFNETLEQDYDEQVELCGEGYLILNYKCEKVITYFEDKIREAGEEADDKDDDNKEDDKTEDDKTEDDKTEEGKTEDDKTEGDKTEGDTTKDESTEDTTTEGESTEDVTNEDSTTEE